MEQNKIVTEQEWIEARQDLLKSEKEITRALDELTRKRRQLPWTRVEKGYIFDGTEGQQSLADLFGKNSQLIIYHYMFGPDWEEGCLGCSFFVDHIDGPNLHLKHHDVSVVVVSRAPFDKLQAFKERMGWQFKWVSSRGSDFNYDYNATYTRTQLDAGDVFHNYKLQKMNFEEQPGLSVFYKNAAGEVFHTYSFYERGADLLLGTHNFLDLTPNGREGETKLMYHDKYGD